MARWVHGLGIEGCPSTRKRAPIFQVIDSSGEVRDELERIARELTIYCPCEKQLVYHNPIIFPVNYRLVNEQDNAYITYYDKNYDEIRIPTQYRDTAVIVDRRSNMLKQSELDLFLNRNPWSSVIIITDKTCGIKRDGILSISASKVKALSNLNDLNILCEMMLLFD